jgi:adenylate kinase
MTETSTGLCGVAHGTTVHRNLPKLVSHMGRTKLVNNYTEFMLDSLHKEGIPLSQDLIFKGILNPKKKTRQLVSSTTETAPYELTVPNKQ